MTRKAILLLRISYWTGAVIDLAAGLIMCIPALFSTFNRLSDFTATPSFRAVAGMGAPLMFGWTILLIWADRRPIERKPVLLITLIPIIGNLINQFLNVQTGFVSFLSAIPQWIMQIMLILLFGFSYWNAVRAEKTGK